MKTISLVLKDAEGNNISGWKIVKFNRVFNFISNQNPRLISGWTLIDGDGYERNFEGNWQTCLPQINLVLRNHGIATRLS